jgi:hypothetical protein
MRWRLISAVLIGGALAGVIDVGAAALISQGNYLAILRTIAGGLLGASARGGGLPMSVLGLVLQVAMGIVIAAIFAAASIRLPDLTKRWWAWGVVYGVGIFLVMNYVVLPLSAWRVTPHFTPTKLIENLLAMLLFGLIVAFASRWGFRADRTR